MLTKIEKYSLYLFVISELILVFSIMTYENFQKQDKVLFSAMALVFLIFPFGLLKADRRFKLFFVVGILYSFCMSLGLFFLNMNLITPPSYLDISRDLLIVLFFVLMFFIARFKKSQM